jgi:hypothetical protein
MPKTSSVWNIHRVALEPMGPNSINPSIKDRDARSHRAAAITGVVVGADNRRINEETGMGKGAVEAKRL